MESFFSPITFPPITFPCLIPRLFSQVTSNFMPDEKEKKLLSYTLKFYDYHCLLLRENSHGRKTKLVLSNRRKICFAIKRNNEYRMSCSKNQIEGRTKRDVVVLKQQKEKRRRVEQIVSFFLPASGSSQLEFPFSCFYPEKFLA